MENKEKVFSELNRIWLGFLGFLILYTIIIWIRHPFPLEFKPYSNTFSNFSSIPITVKMLFFLGIGEFIFVAGKKNTFRKVFQKINTKAIHIMAWAFAESIALYGFIAAFITKNGVYYPPFLILSIIALFIWKPNKSEIENESGENPYSFE